MNHYNDVLIGSDHNLDFLKSMMHKPTELFITNLLNEGFVPTISKPTRVTHQSNTLIDNIFCKGNSVFDYESFVIVDDISDHYPCVLRVVKKLKKAGCNDRILYKRRLTDDVYLKLNQHLLFHDWNMLYHMIDVDEMYNYLVNTVNYYLDVLAPKKEILITARELFREPWMNVKLCKLNTKCKRLFKIAMQNKNDESKYKRYKLYRRTLNRLKLFEKHDFYKKLFTKIGSDMKSLWSVLNSLVRRTNNKVDSIELIVDNTHIKKPSEICNYFNEHFVDVGNKVESQILTTGKNPLDYMRKVDNELLFGKITETEIFKIVDRLKAKQSAGLDGISNEFLKRIINSIKAPLCFVINKSLNLGIFPSSMKIAKVRALFKNTGECSNPDNYRPISLLSVLSKVVERIVYVRLVSHMELNEIIYPRQFGFRQGHSTNDAFTLLVGETLNALNDNFYLLSVFIDLKKGL